MVLRNVTQNTVIAHRPKVALNWWTRARGMIGREFRDFDALIFPRCGSIHTCFMRQALDLIFLNDNGRVVKVVHQARPWRIFLGASGSSAVIELPPDRLYGIPIQLDDMVSWST